MSEPGNHLGAELEELLAAERGAPCPPAAVRQKVWRRVQRSITSGGGGPDGGAGGTAATGGLLKAAVVVLAVGGAAGIGLFAGHPGRGVPGGRAAVPLPEATGSTLPGSAVPGSAVPGSTVATGGPTRPAEDRAQPPVERIENSSAAPARRLSDARDEPRPPRRIRPRTPRDPASTARLETSARSRPPPRRARDPAHGPGRSLGRELALLQPARSAMLRGNFEAALRHLRAHGKEFPGGALAAEREALRIQALVRIGRRKQARAAATRFRDTWPDSLLLPAVEKAVETSAGPS